MRPSGEIIRMFKNEARLGCTLGFTFMSFSGEKNYETIIIPCYFPEKRTAAGEGWINIYHFEDKDGPCEVKIDYTLMSVNDGVARIRGLVIDNIIIFGNFDIEKGYWRDYAVYTDRKTKITSTIRRYV